MTEPKLTIQWVLDRIEQIFREAAYEEDAVYELFEEFIPECHKRMMEEDEDD